jgi:hypothetical protein
MRTQIFDRLVVVAGAGDPGSPNSKSTPLTLKGNLVKVMSMHRFNVLMKRPTCRNVD